LRQISSVIFYGFNPCAHLKRDSALTLGFNPPPLYGRDFLLKIDGIEFLKYLLWILLIRHTFFQAYQRKSPRTGLSKAAFSNSR
jgi:hypothetical protein